MYAPLNYKILCAVFRPRHDGNKCQSNTNQPFIYTSRTVSQKHNKLATIEVKQDGGNIILWNFIQF